MLVELEVLPGLANVAAGEARRTLAAVTVAGPTRLRARAATACDATALRTIVAAYSVDHFDIPRPRALLGRQHLDRLGSAVAAVAATAPFEALRLAGAGSDSAVFQRLAAELGAELGLGVDAEDGDLVVRVVRARPSGWDVLVRLTPRPLASRPWRVRTVPGALNATIAAAMVELAGPPGGLAVNLLCGSGTLLVEHAMRHRGAAVGLDHDPDALRATYANAAAAGVAIPVVLGDVDAPGLRDAGAAVVYADLPYGDKVGSHAANERLYPAFLATAARLCRSGSRLVVITHELRRFERLLAADARWREERSLQVFQKGHHPRIWLLTRR